MTANPDRVHSVLLVGGPSTGKTHYGAQLLGRLQLGRGGLRLRRAPESITPFTEALECLAQGRAADHTARETYEEVILQVSTPSGAEVDLVWPDYGGEQVRRLMEERRVDDDWRGRIENSGGWMLVVRPFMLHSEDDIFSRPIHELAEIEGQGAEEKQWSNQAWYVELLQILRHIRGVDSLSPGGAPPLAIILSCWDELDETRRSLTPPDLLHVQLPLLDAFIRSHWREDSVRVFGLSSLGQELHKEAEDQAYIERGPEEFGYVLDPSGEQHSDISLPLQWLLAPTVRRL